MDFVTKCTNGCKARFENFDKNVKNDQIKQEKLRELGWKVIVIWECELKRSFQETMDKVEKELTRKPFIGAQN